MSPRETSVQSLTHTFAILAHEIKLRKTLNLQDLGIHAEYVFRDLLNRIYEDRSFFNLNDSQYGNYPAIDLGDDIQEIAIQVTSDNSREKVVETLEKYGKGENAYQKIVILHCDSQKPNRYKSFSDITPEGVKLEEWCFEDLVKLANNKEGKKLDEISNFLFDEIDSRRAAIKKESNEVITIMSLIEYLSHDENTEDTEELESEVDPNKKIYHRFEEHANYIETQYMELYTLYSKTLMISKTAIGLDGVRAKKISLFLKDLSNRFLNMHGNNPMEALEALVDYFESKLTGNGIRCDRLAIKYYLLNELINCNVFPNPKAPVNAVL